MSGPPDIALFLGRLHPLLVHLPIGLVLLLAFLEFAARWPRFRSANSNAGLILAVTVPASLITALCGWLLSLGGGYQDHLLQLHKWLGLATAAACLFAGVLYRLDLKKPYRFTLFASVLALVIASHFGGSLTHGSDYLARYAPIGIRRWLGGTPAPAAVATALGKNNINIDALKAFSDVVQPVFQNDCVSCHGPEKSKAKLRLDSLNAILKGGENGAAVVAGKAGESLLIKRLHLPASDEDHMPPDGKPQPTAEEIALLQWWVDSGASDKTLAQLNPPPQINRILQTRFKAPAILAKAAAPRPLADALPLGSKMGDELQISILGMSAKEPWLQANASIAGKNFGDGDLQKLTVLGSNIRWLDLAGTSITDTGLVALASMPNLTRLHLERTAITDAGLTKLAPLQSLEYLDLYGTAITDAGLPTLQKLPALKQLYLWQTKVTPNAAQTFAAARLDKDQLQRWQDEIAQLQARIRDAQLDVEMGTSTASASAGKAAPINTECPVSGKPVDPSKTTLYEGSVVAFCCDDCKAKFEKDPQPFLSKLNLPMPKNKTSPPK